MKIRLFIKDIPLAKEQRYALGKSQSHYLKNVLRLKVGDEVFIFNNKNGEFREFNGFKNGRTEFIEG